MKKLERESQIEYLPHNDTTAHHLHRRVFTEPGQAPVVVLSELEGRKDFFHDYGPELTASSFNDLGCPQEGIVIIEHYAPDGPGQEPVFQSPRYAENMETGSLYRCGEVPLTRAEVELYLGQPLAPVYGLSYDPPENELDYSIE